jgi:outer membrane immunogenic protein
LVKWFGTARGRAGVVAFENVLVYLTAGAAYGEMSWGWSKTAGNPGSFSASEVKLGYTFGGGVELAYWNPITIKAEVLYVDFLENTLTFRSGVNTYRQDHDDTMWVYRLGLNYKFGYR